WFINTVARVVLESFPTRRSPDLSQLTDDMATERVVRQSAMPRRRPAESRQGAEDVRLCSSDVWAQRACVVERHAGRSREPEHSLAYARGVEGWRGGHCRFSWRPHRSPSRTERTRFNSATARLAGATVFSRVRPAFTRLEPRPSGTAPAR